MVFQADSCSFMPICAVPSDFIGFALRKALINIGLKGLGGEGGIRTPDSLATMSDFESGGEAQALNIYKGIILRKASVLAGVSVCKACCKRIGYVGRFSMMPSLCPTMSTLSGGFNEVTGRYIIDAISSRKALTWPVWRRNSWPRRPHGHSKP